MKRAFWCLLLFASGGFASAQVSTGAAILPAEALNVSGWYLDKEVSIPIPHGDAPQMNFTRPNSFGFITQTGKSSSAQAWKVGDGVGIGLPQTEGYGPISALSSDLIYQAFVSAEGVVSLRKGYEETKKAASFRFKKDKEGAVTTGAVFSPDGRWLAAGLKTEKKGLRVAAVDVFEGKAVRDTEEFDADPEQMLFRPDGVYLTGLRKAGGFWFWETASKDRPRLIDEKAVYAGLSFSEDGARFAAAGKDKSSFVKIFDGDTASEIARFDMPGNISAVGLNFDGQEFAADVEGRGLMLFDAKSGNELWTLDTEKGGGSLAQDPLGNYLLWLNEWRRVRIWTFGSVAKAAAKIGAESAALENKLFHRRRLRLSQSEEMTPERRKEAMERFEEQWVPKFRAIDVLKERVYYAGVPVSGAYDPAAGGYEVFIASRPFIAPMSKAEAAGLAAKAGAVQARLKLRYVSGTAVGVDDGAELLDLETWTRYPLKPAVEASTAPASALP